MPPSCGTTTRAGALILQVRGFAGWPGTTANLCLEAEGQEAEPQAFKILRTSLNTEQSKETGPWPRIEITGRHLLVHCGHDSNEGCLEVLELQPVGKKAMPVAAFLNGLNDKKIRLA